MEGAGGPGGTIARQYSYVYPNIPNKLIDAFGGPANPDQGSAQIAFHVIGERP